MAQALITIKNTSITHGIETTIVTPGVYEKKEAEVNISYDETQATGFEGSRTVFTVSGGKDFEMERIGSYPCYLYIDRDRKNFALYGTPGGNVKVGVLAKELNSSFDENGGSFNIKYEVDVNSSLVGEYEISAEIRLQDTEGIKQEVYVREVDDPDEIGFQKLPEIRLS